MIIHFKHVDENADGEQSRDKGPLAFGESTDEWTALCSLHTLTIYEQEFQNDPASPHKSLVDDVTTATRNRERRSASCCPRTGKQMRGRSGRCSNAAARPA